VLSWGNVRSQDSDRWHAATQACGTPGQDRASPCSRITGLPLSRITGHAGRASRRDVQDRHRCGVKANVGGGTFSSRCSRLDVPGSCRMLGSWARSQARRPGRCGSVRRGGSPHGRVLRHSGRPREGGAEGKYGTQATSCSQQSSRSGSSPRSRRLCMRFCTHAMPAGMWPGGTGGR